MNRRILYVAIGLVVLVVPAIVIAYLIHRSPSLQNTVAKLGNLNTSANTNTTVTAVTPTANTNKNNDDVSITFVSRNFAETYGSGSNQNNFANVVEAEKWATANYKQFLNASIAQQKATLVTTPYHAFLTTALVIKINGQTEKTANVVVSTQRQETTDKTTKTYYQDLSVDLLKVGTEWQVNAAAWKPV